MHKRTWVTFIAVNVIVSAAVMLTILFIWERVHIPSSPSPTPTPTRPATGEAVSAPTAPPPASPTPPGPVLYTVQAGDTLGAVARSYGVSVEELMAANGLSDPNVLAVGQTLVIPVAPPPPPTTDPSAERPLEPSPTMEPLPTTVLLPTPLPTLTPSGPPLVEIGQVLGSGDLAAEVVVVRNRGGAVSLEGWTLADAEGNTFTFPKITLFANTQVRVHSPVGSSTPSDLYWGRATPAWDGGELITLRDGEGNVVDTYIVP
jgi:LysM repeat protein